MGNIKPLETFYNGYRFRSRLEARWAIFFDALGVTYEYEPEGYDLGNHIYYLPDFRIKCHGTRGNSNEKPFDLYIEVKGEMTKEDAKKIRLFHNAPQCDGCDWDVEEGLLFTYNRDEWEKKRDSGYFIEHCERKCLSKMNRILIVGNILNPETYNAKSSDTNGYSDMNGIDIYPWNYETIDNDYFACYPAVKDGCFYLDGDDSNYQTMNLEIIREALRLAKTARFEHGETPVISRIY